MSKTEGKVAETRALSKEEIAAQIWADTDWSKKESMYKNWPVYIQEQLQMARQKNISKTVDLIMSMRQPFSTNYLLQDARLLLEPNKRICLIGDASCGKSTLLHELAAGNIKDFPKHLWVHHCEEIPVTPEPISLVDYVVKAHEYRNILLKCKDELKTRMAAENVPEETMAGMKANLDLVEFNLNKIRSDDAYMRASKMLRVLGFEDDRQKHSTNSLSGGLRMRVALCAAFFIEADLLLLDEPTNHLDFPSVLWLENRLRGYRGSFLLISHDRELLENVCTSLIWMDSKKLLYYNCGFAEFEKKKAEAEKKKDAEIDKFMQMNRNVDPTSMKAKEKAEKQAWQENYQQRQIQLAGKFTFPDIVALPKNEGDPANPADISIIRIDQVRFSYDVAAGLPFIFDTPIDLNVTASTRMGIMGPNGAGKSTLLKLLTRRLTPVSGTVTHHPTATIAYFAQHHAAELNLEQTPMEYMIMNFPKVKSGELRKHLDKVGINGPKADTRMKSLSAGQRSCVMFAKITFVCPHLLIMDEPTNFLDLESVDSLIAATNKYRGALLLVSHNRVFLKKCATHYLSVVPGKFLIFDNMKECERATYSFIQDLEEGVGAGKIGQAALVGSASRHGNLNAGEKKEDAGPAFGSAGFTLSISAARPAKKAAPKVVAAAPAAAPAKRGGPAARGGPAGRGAPARGRGGK